MSTPSRAEQLAPPPADQDPRVAAYERLFGAHYRAVAGFVARRVHPTHVEDVVAEVFLVAWRRQAQIPVEPESRPWLLGVARNVILAQCRAAGRQTQLQVRLADDLAVARQHDDSETVATRLDVARAWRMLTPASQEVISLAVHDGLTGPQAARALGISPVAYRLRLSRARRALRRFLAATPSPAAALNSVVPEGPRS